MVNGGCESLTLPDKYEARFPINFVNYAQNKITLTCKTRNVDYQITCSTIKFLVYVYNLLQIEVYGIKKKLYSLNKSEPRGHGCCFQHLARRRVFLLSVFLRKVREFLLICNVCRFP